MRFMYIVTSPKGHMMPNQGLMDAILKIRDREIKAGRMIDDGGLMPVATGARVKISDNKLSVIDGPFVEAKEVIGGYALLRAGSKAEVVELCRKFLKVAGQGTCEVHALFEQSAAGGRPAR